MLWSIVALWNLKYRVECFDCIQLCDFGLAKWRNHSKTKTNSKSLRGTVTHIPPENWRDINAPRSVKYDIYSFGILMWQLMTQQVPFAGPDDSQGQLLSKSSVQFSDF